MKLTEVPYEQTKNFTKSILRHTLIVNCRNKTISKYGGIKAYFKMLFLLWLATVAIYVLPFLLKGRVLINSYVAITIAVILTITFGYFALRTKKHPNYLSFFILENVFSFLVGINTFIFIVNAGGLFVSEGMYSDHKLLATIFYTLVAILTIYVIWRCWKSVKKDLSIEGNDKISILKNLDYITKRIAAFGLPLLLLVYICKDIGNFILGKLNIQREFKGFYLFWLVAPGTVILVILLEIVYYPMYVFLPAYYLWKYRAEYERDNHFSYEGKKAEVK